MNRRLSRWCGAVGLIAFLSHPLIGADSGKASGTSGASDRTVQQILLREEEWAQAIVKNDAEALERLYAEEFQATIPSMQVVTKADALAFGPDALPALRDLRFAG